MINLKDMLEPIVWDTLQGLDQEMQLVSKLVILYVLVLAMQGTNLTNNNNIIIIINKCD